MFWLKQSPAAELIMLSATLAPLLALVTSLIQGGIWVVATFFEVALGAIVARFFIPMPAMNGLLYLSPLLMLIIFGALWGFWFI